MKSYIHKHSLSKIYVGLSLFHGAIEGLRELREGYFIVVVVIKSGEAAFYVRFGQSVVEFE
jgi:hypothetical protein